MDLACSQDLESQVTTGEEELGLVKSKAEETEGVLRQTVEQLNEVSLMSFYLNNNKNIIQSL